MQNYSAGPKALFASLWHNKGLIRHLVHCEVVGRYKSSMLGIVWSFVTPVFMLAVYTFVFSFGVWLVAFVQLIGVPNWTINLAPFFFCISPARTVPNGHLSKPIDVTHRDAACMIKGF